MFVIGITGPTGAGKTTALQELEKLGGKVVDCDALYHTLLRDNGDLQRELQGRFGAMDGPDGTFDRKKLGAVVFHDPQALADLNAIAHRYVVQGVQALLDEWEKQGVPAAAIDAIGLFESGLDRLCSATLAITAPPEVRVQRIVDREGISQSYARARVQAQNPDVFYTSRCGYTLVNDCASAGEFAQKARTLFQALLGGEGVG